MSVSSMGGTSYLLRSRSAATTPPKPSFVASSLSALLETHNVTTTSLAMMAEESYWPQSPRNVDEWNATVVTPVPQGINGSLVQAVGYTNPDTSERILSFMGVYLSPAHKNKTDYAEPYSTCLAADVEFKGTDAENAWQETCTFAGRVDTNLSEWASQAKLLVQEFRPTFLSGHSQGCSIAISEGILTGLPVVCFSIPGELTNSWMDAYPGLKDAVNDEKQQRSDSLYSLQTWTDPYSNCLQPYPSSGLVNVCGFE